MREEGGSNSLVRKLLFLILGALSLSGHVAPSAALALGLCIALTMGNPFPGQSRTCAKWLLQGSVVGLGFGMNLVAVWEAGRTGFGFTVATVFGTLLVGWLVGRALGVDRETSLLVSTGTSICGGSAIAAVGAAIQADARAMSVSLGAVFILNALALFIFPPIGHLIGMDQQQFGVWSAIAIHDTSSVVGASARYGEQALSIATTVKLARALWIFPIALGVALIRRNKKAGIAFPWFILLFLVAAGIRTAYPAGAVAYDVIRGAAKLGLTLTLFLIGAGLSRDAIRSVGVRAMVQGVILWLVISLAGLVSVMGIVR